MYPPCPERLASKISRISTLIALVLVAFATLFSVTCSHAADAPAKTGSGRAVRAGIFNFKPLVIFDQKSPPTGFIVDILNHIAKQEEWNVEYVPGTWQESLERLRTDKIDIILCIGYSAERAVFLDFPKEHVLLDWGLVYRKKGSNINTIMDMEGKTIAAMKASIYTAGFKATLEQFHIKATIVEKTEVKDVFGALEAGEVDAAISSTIAGLSFESSQKVDRSPVVFTPVKLGYAVNSGKNSDLTAAIDKRLSELKSDKNSYYYKKLDEWVTARRHTVPKAFYWIIGVVSSALLIFMAFVIILRRQVKAKTNILKTEIEQRKHIEESLRTISSRQSAILSSVPDIIMETDTNKVYTWANPAGLEFFGDDVIGKEASYFFEGDQTTYQIVQPLFEKSADVLYIESLQRRKDGTARLLAWWSKALVDEQGVVTGVLSTARDITERKQAEEALQEQSKRNAALIDGFPYPVLLIGKDRMIIASNKVAQDMGVVPGKLCWCEFGRSAAIPAAAKKYLEEHGSPPPEGTHCWFCRADATLAEQNLQNDPEVESNGRFYDTYWSPLSDETYLHYAIDVTERKQAEAERHLLEQQFQQTQKLESLGVLAGGIAHDFNNILAIIMGNCSLATMDDENAGKYIPEIEKASERAAALCRQMLAYAGKASLTQSQVNSRTLVDEMVSMLKTTIPQNVVIKPELDTDIPLITGDASQLRQVVMNLIINGAEAIGDAEGEIDVKLAKAEIRAEQPEIDHLGVIIPAGRYICFEVIDNGCGMDEETSRKIFEPFYTTKFTGRGLGMSAVLGIIKAHNGALQLESRPGGGTTFKVFLPVQISKFETEEDHQKAASSAWQGSGTILLAEDEVPFKAIAIALIQKLGFKVIDAANGKEALELYQHNAADITMVVTDMGMPVMNGYELFFKLKQLNPQLPIIISSGFGEGDIGSKIPHEDIAGMINKPYNFDHLRDVLKGVVEGVP